SLTLFRNADGAQLPFGWRTPLRGPLRHEGSRKKRLRSLFPRSGAELRRASGPLVGRPERAAVAAPCPHGTRPADRQVSPPPARELAARQSSLEEAPPSASSARSWAEPSCGSSSPVTPASRYSAMNSRAVSGPIISRSTGETS